MHSPEQEPSIPAPSRVPTPETIARSQWELTQAAYRSPEDVAQQWMQDIRLDANGGPIEPGNQEREAHEATLRRQLISVYGFETDVDALGPRDLGKIVHRLGLLGLLVEADPDPVDLVRAGEFAYDFVHLVLKEAITEDKVVDERRDKERLHELATHDPLTGLKNLRGLAEDLRSMIALAESGVYNGIALLYLDLDNFKLVNDHRGFGHGFGNEMLRGVARILENGTRKPSRGGPADVVARPETSLTSESTGAADDESPEGEVIRPHGDEFIILILDTGPAITTRAPHPSRQTEEQPLSSDDRALRIASRFTNPITEYMNRITRGEIPGLGVSIGYALWRPGMDEEDLIRAGDWAMYEVKRARKTGDSPEQPQR